MKPLLKSSAIILSAIISLSLIVPSCGRPSQRVVEETKFFMGTVIQIKVALAEGSDFLAARKAIGRAFDEIGRVEDVFSVYKPDSEISRINRLKKNERLQISDEVFSLIKKSVEYSKKTEGAFDITVKPLVDLWNKAKKNNKLPGEDEIKLALDHIGYENIVLDDRSRTISFKKEEMALDLGGVAKGYATDRAIRVLKENRIEDAIVNSGGDVYCLGKRAKDELWKVGVRDPRHRKKIFLEIKLEDMAIDTSGDYEKCFILNGKRYSHIIDPRTGYAIGDDVVSSSVIAPDCSTADALATSLIILGNRGLAIAESVKRVDAILVFKRNDKLVVKMTDGIRKRYEIHEENL